MDEDIFGKSMVVYLVTNTINNKKYVGQTQRILSERINEHRRSKTSVIYHAIKKYDRKNFTVDILDECKTIDELNEREIYWIKKLNTKTPNGYNLTDGGVGTTGHTYTVDARKNALKRVFSLEQLRHMSEVAPNRNENRTVGGYHWRQIGSPQIQSTNKKKAVLCVETNQIFDSIKAASRWAGVSKSLISRVLSNKKLTAGGYHWKILEDYYADANERIPKKTAIMCVETGEVFPMVKTAAEWAGVTSSTISAALAGRTQTAGGYHWIVAD